MKDDGKSFLFFSIATIAFLFIGFGLAYSKAAFEAAAYNRITGKNVSAWDAMFVELRVDGEAKDE